MTDTKRSGVSPDECARFQEIWELRLADELEPDQRDLAFLRSHATGCPTCARLMDLLHGIETPEPISEVVIDRVLAARRGGHSGRLRIALAAGVGMAAAAAVFAVMVFTGEGSEERSRSIGGEIVLVDSRGGEAARGDLIVTGEEPALLHAKPLLSLGVGPRSRVEVATLSEEEIAIDLTDGVLAASLMSGAGASMVVSTRDAKVRVTGTVFSVSATARGTAVMVVEGSVRVERGARIVEVSKEEVSGADGELGVLDKKERNAVLSLLGMLPAEEQARAVALADNRETAVEGMDTTEKPARDSKPAVEVGCVDRGAAKSERKDQQVEDTRGPTAQATNDETVEDCMLRAREQRKTGDWAGAAETYRSAMARFPASPESATILMALAEIELTHLRRADLALGRFERYVAVHPSGPLAEEAMHGKCLALRALGRHTEERVALEGFLARFPESVHARNVRARLSSMEVK